MTPTELLGNEIIDAVEADTTRFVTALEKNDKKLIQLALASFACTVMLLTIKHMQRPIESLIEGGDATVERPLTLGSYELVGADLANLIAEPEEVVDALGG